MAIKHLFTSAKSDGGDATLVQPGDWNDDHTGIVVLRKTADESVTSSTTLQNDDHLTFSIAASEVWIIDATLFVVGAEAGDIKTAWSVPSGATGVHGVVGLGKAFTAGPSDTPETAARISVDAVTTITTAVNSGVTPGDEATLLLRATVVNSTNAGSVTLQWAQLASSGTATTVRSGSHLVAYKA